MVRTDIRLPNRRIIWIRRRGAEIKRYVLTIRSSWWSSSGVEIFREPPRFLWCGRPKILLMHPWDTPASWLLLANNCYLLTTWQFTAVFALANFVAWSPLRLKNINILYRNTTLHKSIKVVMARQTSLQLTTPELTFFSFSCVPAVPRQYWLCVAIQFGYVMDRWNQKYFIPQLNIRAEALNTHQMQANTI